MLNGPDLVRYSASGGSAVERVAYLRAAVSSCREDDASGYPPPRKIGVFGRSLGKIPDVFAFASAIAIGRHGLRDPFGADVKRDGQRLRALFRHTHATGLEVEGRPEAGSRKTPDAATSSNRQARRMGTQGQGSRGRRLSVSHYLQHWREGIRRRLQE